MIHHYQITIEGVFINAPELGPELGGFYTTFFLRGNNASNAAHKASFLLADRMALHRVMSVRTWFRGSYCCVHDLLEVTEERFLEQESSDLGFTFYRISPVARVFLAVRGQFLLRFRPWKLLNNAITR